MVGLTELFSRLGPTRLPPASTHRVERASHASGGRARGRRADAAVTKWVAGGRARGDAARVAAVFRHLGLVPVECQKRCTLGEISTAVDLIARPAAGGSPIAVELKTGFADRWTQPIGNSRYTPKYWAILQAACGACMLGLKKALVIRVLDTKVEFVWAGVDAFQTARQILSRGAGATAASTRRA